MSRLKTLNFSTLIAIVIGLTVTSTASAQGGFRYGNGNVFRGGYGTQSRFNTPPGTFRGQSSMFAIPGVSSNQVPSQFPAPSQTYNSGYRGNYQSLGPWHRPYDSAPAYETQSYGDGYYRRGYYYSP